MKLRKLTQREKMLVGAVAVVCVVVLAVQIGPALRESLSGGGLAEKQNRLHIAQAIVSAAELTKPLEETLRAQVGLDGRLIPDALFAEIKESVSLAELNDAHHLKELAKALPALEGKVEAIGAQAALLEDMEALKDVRASIFEGEQPQAVISQRIAELATRAGLSPNYQLTIKPMPGKKAVKMATQTRKHLAAVFNAPEPQVETLRKGLAHVPLTYQPEMYLVDMAFKGEIDGLIQLIQEMQSTTKWLQVRDMKLSVADKQNTLLGVNLILIAQVL